MDATRSDLISQSESYKICAQTESKSPRTIEQVCTSVRYFQNFLVQRGKAPDPRQIGPFELRDFIAYLQTKRSYSGHHNTPTQERILSPYSVHAYMRSLRMFFSWLVREELLTEHPFAKVKLPKVPKKVIITLSPDQVKKLLLAIDRRKSRGFRDSVMVMLMLDTGLRVSEVTGMRLSGLSLKYGWAKVMGKGNKERQVPLGQVVVRMLDRYLRHFRVEPIPAYRDLVFVNSHGTPLTRDRIEDAMRRYGRRAGIAGVRCSPHTLRHTCAVSFLRNGGDVFSLQRLLGHSGLEMTRRYCELSDGDVQRVHASASPLDNLGIWLKTGSDQDRLSKSKKEVPGPKPPCQPPAAHLDYLEGGWHAQAVDPEPGAPPARMGSLNRGGPQGSRLPPRPGSR